jgi:C4-dicarboxylate transporter, DctQ subunit
LSALHRLSIWIEKVTNVAVIAFFVALVAAVLIQVGIRFLPIRMHGLSEIARYSQIWFVFLVVALLARHSELIGANMLLNALRGTPKFVLWLLVRILMIGFIGVLTFVAFQFIEFLASTGRRSPELRIPMHYAFGPVLIGSALTLFFLLVDLALRVRLFMTGEDFMKATAELDGAD